MNLLSALLGVIIGIVCGLTPGIHTNLIAVVVSTLPLNPVFACVFLVCVAVTNSIVDAVPSVFLGASEDVMSLLPGHKLLVEGFGVEAVKFTLIGSLFGIVISILLIPVFYYSFPLILNTIKPYMFFIIVPIVAFLLFRNFSIWNFIIFLLSGLLGLIVLSSVKDPLFPLLSGLFGGSGLILSASTKIPKQKKGEITLPKKNIVKGVTNGVLAGSVVTLFPGLGPSQAAAMLPVKNTGFSYLILTGALGSVDVVVSLVTWFVLNKARNGAVVILQQIVGTIDITLFVYVIGCILFSVGTASIFSIYAARLYSKIMQRVNYTIVCISVVVFLNILVLLISGFLGLLVFWIATFVGVLAPLTGACRSHAMGVLIVPLILSLA